MYYFLFHPHWTSQLRGQEGQASILWPTNRHTSRHQTKLPLNMLHSREIKLTFKARQLFFWWSLSDLRTGRWGRAHPGVSTTLKHQTRPVIPQTQSDLSTAQTKGRNTIHLSHNHSVRISVLTWNYIFMYISFWIWDMTALWDKYYIWSLQHFFKIMCVKTFNRTFLFSKYFSQF